jgi:hypothetical protein
MGCVSCGSQKQTKFSAEMVIHFPGRGGFDKPVVPVLTSLTVCLDCGATLFKVPEAELILLEKGLAA